MFETYKYKITNIKLDFSDVNIYLEWKRGHKNFQILSDTQPQIPLISGETG